MKAIIQNAKDVSLDNNSGTLPDMSSSTRQWFQAMTFEVVTKVVQDFQDVETGVDFNFLGVWQPLKEQMLRMKPEGQRKWAWFWCHSDITLQLQPDEIIKYKGVEYRVMARRDYSLYQYMEYELVNDYTGSSPVVE